LSVSFCCISSVAAELDIAPPPKENSNGEGIKRESKKRAQALKELEGLIEDNAAKSERDRNILWRKIQTYIGRNDDIGNE